MKQLIANRQQCYHLAKYLSQLNLPVAQEEKFTCALPPETLGNLYFAVVAICHQTTPRQGTALQGYINGQLRRGWDYLRESWLQAAVANPQLVTPTSLTLLTASDIINVTYDPIIKIVISDAEGRAKLLHQLGQKMRELNIQTVWELYDQSQPTLVATDGRGLLEQLRQFPAYAADPVGKKLFFFLSLMYNQGLWSYQDPENLGTPVDYHEVRGHLRLKTVKVIDQRLHAKIWSGQEVTAKQDITIRQAVFDAIMLISHLSGKTPNDLHYFFWNIFRNCCRRNETHCYYCHDHPSLPERYQQLSPHRCIFNSICLSKDLKHKPQDHLVQTDLY